MKIFILIGSQGEWSDRTEFPIKAFASKEKAEAALLKADKEELIGRSSKGAMYSEETIYFINDVELEE